MNRPIRHVCFDLDNTLVDDTGHHLRPAMRELLGSLRAHGIRLSLWTASTKERTQEILREHRIEAWFGDFVFREDYDPEGIGYPKDITYLNADLLVDDRIEHIEFVRRKGQQGFQLAPFLSPRIPVPVKELDHLHQTILPHIPWP
jgi:hydroxymethylpyrimidine pyrophosphatase-like HAD family hydrolase